jgi:ribosome-binding factor A
MPREFKRSERVAGQLRRDLAQLIQMELSDPEIGFISISDVEVSRDISHAKVYVTVFETEKAESTIQALKRAASFLRRRLGQVMRIRSVPELHFEHDASVETGQRMDELIAEAVAADRDPDPEPDPKQDQDHDDDGADRESEPEPSRD